MFGATNFHWMLQVGSRPIARHKKTATRAVSSGSLVRLVQAIRFKFFAICCRHFKKAMLAGRNVASQAKCFSMKFSNPY